MEHLRKLVSPPPPPPQSHLRLLGRSCSTKVRRRSKVSAAAASAGGHKHLRSNRNIPPLGTDNTHLKDGKGKEGGWLPLHMGTDGPAAVNCLPRSRNEYSREFTVLYYASIFATFYSRRLRHAGPSSSSSSSSP